MNSAIINDPYQIALTALDRMRTDKGADAKFSADEIWGYTVEEVPSLRRPAIIVKLGKHGFIKRTGKMRRATVASRAGNSVPEYCFSTPQSTVTAGEPKNIVDDFYDSLTGLIKVSHSLSLRLVSSLLSKKFVIHTGLAGSGKTKLAQALARWITPKTWATDPFTPGAKIPSGRITYIVRKADKIAVEFWNAEHEDQAIKVTLPREMISEWANYILENSLPEETSSREIREAVSPLSKYSSQLHSFDTHLKAAAYALIKSRQEVNPIQCYQLIPVGADWTSNENILGYPDGLDAGRYVSRPALELMLHAQQYSDLPHFLILDEMNLSHVERYFADLLSAIESGETIPLYDGPLEDQSQWRRANGNLLVPPRLELPSNLFVIGTVNVDETTYLFSPKVLDRANVIEFRMDETDLAAFLADPQKPDISELDGQGEAYCALFVEAIKERVVAPSDVQGSYEAEIKLFFSILRQHDAEFGYRAAHEAARFLHFFKILGSYADGDTAWFNTAFDAIIVQKFLPKLHGSRSRLEGLLWALAQACGPQRDGESPEDTLKRCLAAGDAKEDAKYGLETVQKTNLALYPLSFDKVLRMWRKLARDQFTSFAEA